MLLLFVGAASSIAFDKLKSVTCSRAGGWEHWLVTARGCAFQFSGTSKKTSSGNVLDRGLPSPPSRPSPAGWATSATAFQGSTAGKASPVSLSTAKPGICRHSASQAAPPPVTPTPLTRSRCRTAVGRACRNSIPLAAPSACGRGTSTVAQCRPRNEQHSSPCPPHSPVTGGAATSSEQPPLRPDAHGSAPRTGCREHSTLLHEECEIHGGVGGCS